MRYYVVSDIHGYYKELRRALDAAGFFSDTEPHKLILCGDLLDRGSEALPLVDFMLELMKKNMLIYVLGNHEELLIDCLQQISRGGIHPIASGMSHHYSNGTWDTLLQIAKMSDIEAYNSPDELVRRVMRSPLYKRLLTICRDYYETDNYIFVHGWIPCFMKGNGPAGDFKFNKNWRGADMSAWRRARWYNGMRAACLFGVTEPSKTIVCGHWHASYGHAKIEKRGTEFGPRADFTPFYGKGIIAIDACTAQSRFVNCIVIED